MTNGIILGFAEGEGEGLGGVAVEMPALDLVAEWRRCGMSADFLAGYMAYDYADRPAALNVLSTIINELLENAAKFSAEKRKPVRILVSQLGHSVRVEVSNIATAERAEALRRRLADVLDNDPEELFIRHLEGAGAAPPGAPGIGLVVLRKDYGARLGARLEPRPDGLFDVTIWAGIPAEEVDPS